MKTLLCTHRKLTGLRLTITSLVVLTSASLWASSAQAQDAIVLYSGYVPADDTTLVVKDYTAFTVPYERCGKTWVGMLELIVTGSASTKGQEIYVEVSFENPLRTLKKGDRLVSTSGVLACNGSYLVTTFVAG